jgi:hypothetical protein
LKYSAALPPELDRLEPLQVALDERVRRIDPRRDAKDELARLIAVGQPEEGPRSFLVAPDQPGIEEELEMTRHPRLGLVEYLREVGDRQVATREQEQDAKPAGFGRRLHRINHGVEADGRAVQHGISPADIKISLCRSSH